MKTLILILFLISAIVLGVEALEYQGGPPHPPVFKDIPPLVLELLAWPDAAVLSSRGVSTNVAELPRIMRSVDAWIRQIIDPVWIPNEPETVALLGGNGKRDTVHHRWTKGEFTFRIGQSRNILAVEVQPITGMGKTMDFQHLLERAREVSRLVLAKSLRRRTLDFQEVQVPHLNERIVEFSFSAETTRVLASEPLIIFGRPKSMEECGVQMPQTEAALRALLQSQGEQEWVRSALGWFYWFRHLYWSADEKRLLLFMWKTEGGPADLGPDVDWFNLRK